MSAEGPVTVGLDLGTAGARALAVADDGSVVARGARSLTGERAGRRHEQDPATWWEAIAAACREALSAIAPERVRGVATCATSGTVLLVDRAGRPLTRALMYDDARAVEQGERVGMAASWGLPKLLWLREHDPGAGVDGARLAHQPDIVTAALTGRPTPSDASHALKSGHDPERGWPSERARDCGELLPEVVAPGTRLGEVCPAAAARTGLPAGAPVIAGMTDGCAAQIAAGALRPGACNCVLGTTLVVKGCATRRIEDHVVGVYSHRAPDGCWWPGGASSSGAGVLPATFPGRDIEALIAAAAGHERTTVLVYPLPGGGERFPFAAPQADGFMLGRPASDGEHVAALLQGVALVERLCLERLARLGVDTAGELSLTGGATRSRAWCELRAAALGRAVRLPQVAESAFGMAILARAAVDDEPLTAAAARMSHTRAQIEPGTALGAHLDEQYARLVAELRRRGWLHGD